MNTESSGGQSPITFGLRLPNSGPLATTEAVIMSVDAAESLGYDAVWANDHISWTPKSITHFSAGSIEACADQDPNFFESLTSLAFIAGRTQKVRLVASVLVVPLRDPRVLARQVLTIDALSGGRLTLAMGIGGIRHDFDVMQVPWEKRGRIGNEHLAALDAALSDASLAEYQGDLVKFSGAGFFPKPSGLKRWIAGGSPAAYRRAARWADGWMVTAKSPEKFAEQRRDLYATLAEVGRAESSITCAAQVSITVEASYDEALRVAARTLEHRLGGVEEGLKAAAIGTPEQAIEKLQAYIDAGVTHFGLKIVAHSLEHYLTTAQRIAEEVICKLR